MNRALRVETQLGIEGFFPPGSRFCWFHKLTPIRLSLDQLSMGSLNGALQRTLPTETCAYIQVSSSDRN